MSKAGTKTTVKRQDVKKRKMDNIYKEVTRLTKDKKVADQLIAKYGVDCAYSIVRESMQAPGNVMQRMGRQWKNSSDTIKFFVEADLNDVVVAKGIRKTSTFVAESKKNVTQTPRQVAKKNPSVNQAAARAQTNNQTVAKKTQRREIKNTKQSVKVTAPQYPNLLQPIRQESNLFILNNPLTQAMQVETNPFNMFQTPKLTTEQKVEAELAQMKKDNPNGITLGSLKEDGFTISAQTIKESDLKYLHAGKDGKGIGQAVKKATGKVKGADQCGAAVRIGYTSYMNETYNAGVPKSEFEFYGKRKPDGTIEWGSSAAETLYKKFNQEYFTVLSYPNKGNNSALNNVPDGTTIFYEGKDGRKLKSGIEHPGHTATYNAADGCWYAGNYHQDKSKINNGAGYGKNYRIAIANDTKVDDELARAIIRAKIEENERITQNAQVRNAARGR